MSEFPRTTVGGVSVSRMIIGSNWFLGWSHCTEAKDRFIKTEIAQRKKISDILVAFLNYGVDTVMGMAQDRTGRKMIIVSTPDFPFNRTTAAKGFDRKKVAAVLEKEVEMGSTFCMPHQQVTDAMTDRCTRRIRRMASLCRMIRDYGLIPGLSTHMPEAIVYADETKLDVETYISLYNAAGFLMPIEVDWVGMLIQQAEKPVMCIKPMAAGQLRPFQGLTFVWNSIRDQDMVTVGAMTPDEAIEDVELSLRILERRSPDLRLQSTRSKSSVKTKKLTKFYH